MKKILLILTIGLNILFANTNKEFQLSYRYDYSQREGISEKVNLLLTGKLDELEKSCNDDLNNRNDSYGVIYLLLGNIAILKGDLSKAQRHYLKYATTVSNDYDSDISIENISEKQFNEENWFPLYKELYLTYPDRKEALDKGLETILNTIPLVEEWHKKLPELKIPDIGNWAKSVATPKEAKKWIDAGFSSENTYILNKLNIKTLEKAQQWTDTGFSVYDIEKLHEMGINTLDKLKPYLKIKNVYRIEMLVHLDVKPTPLAESMIDQRYVLWFSKEDFHKILKILIKSGCKRVEKNPFPLADEYDNNGLCYVFGSDLFQRLGQNSGLAHSGKPFYAIFGESWSEGSTKLGVIQGMGNYQYKTTSGAFRIVPKGKVLIFRNLINGDIIDVR